MLIRGISTLARRYNALEVLEKCHQHERGRLPEYSVMCVPLIVVMVAGIARLTRRLWVAVQLKPRAAGSDPLGCGYMGYVPYNEVCVLNGLPIVVDRWYAAGGAGHTRPRHAPGTP